MQKITVGKLGKNELVYTQLENEEDIKKANVPNGTFFFWEYEGRRIYSPGEIISLVIEHSHSGTLEVNDFISPRNIQAHYRSLFENQRKSIVSQFERMKADLLNTSMTKEARKIAIDNLNKTIEFYKNDLPFPSVNGLFEPNLKQAEIIVGGKDKLKKLLTPEQQAVLFGGK